MDEAIYLSPRKLLSYLCELETKIPIQKFSVYKPHISNSCSDNDLNEEAKRMLAFVGLNQCVPDCKFQITQDGVGGFAINNKSSSSISIVVSNKYQGNATACSAILAHEICHKVIYLHNIDFPSANIFTEIFTDLCTIYIGFGNLIIDGYKQGNSQVLGYLKFDMYNHALQIVQRTKGGYEPERIKGVNDPILEDTLEYWEKAPDVKDSIKTFFMAQEEKLSEVNRNILLLIQILEQVYLKHGDIFKNLSDTYSPSFNHKGENSLALFHGLYACMFDRSEETKFTTTQKGIYNLILYLTDEYKDIDLAALSYENLRCPCCGKKAIIKNIIDRDTIIRCSSCGVYFRFCNSYLNITKMRQERKKLRRAEELQKELFKRDNIEADSKLLKLKKEKEDFARQQQFVNDNFQAQLSDSARKSWELAEESYQIILDDIPKWIKKILGKKLPPRLH